MDIVNNIYIVKNEKPLWTQQHLEHYIKYRDVYGLDLTTEKIVQEIRRLGRGLPGRRHDPETECYDIYSESGELAGEITLSQVSFIPEVSIVIFDQYSGDGLAKRALSVFVNLLKGRYTKLEAVIKSDNPALCAASHILESAGFIYQCILPRGALLFVKEFADN